MKSTRREFIKTASLGLLATGFSMPAIPDFLKEYKMGIVVHSYGHRYGSKVGSSYYPGFQNTLDFMRHCHAIGAGGIQIGVGTWFGEMGKKVREAREELGMYLEASIAMPEEEADVTRFENEVLLAKEAGVKVIRTVCLGGRRYENFKSREEFVAFKAYSIQRIQLAEKVARKHQMKLAIENHKDWKAAELVEILQNLSSEWVGATVDFGNNISLLEYPDEVIETLAPYAFSTHVKDMGVKEYEEGFLLSEVPLGKGIVKLKKGIELCKSYHPEVNISLEMITRDPLKIPCFSEDYWKTFENPSSKKFKKYLQMISKESFDGKLPTISNLEEEEILALEEKNVVECLRYYGKLNS
ncbi:sugar phosphate isomerase/epimerase family protein [Algoriphagus algorifonticola]|uniref:sugar phosphate isomerase/epimerase family protein n=1 Tax=Algoriphagus algorifonticola TaxID=2593007 RepID=UPI0011AA4497|nr:TIM barrel protein [Algoriphagus algorifonticola]